MKDDAIQILAPSNYDTSRLGCTTGASNLLSYGILPTDVLLYYHTRDIRAGDFIFVSVNTPFEQGQFTVRVLWTTKDCLRARDDEYEDAWKKGECSLIGRVLHIERNGRIVHEFRPIEPMFSLQDRELKIT